MPARRRSRRLDAIELVEDALEIGRPVCPAPSSSDLRAARARRRAGAAAAIIGAGRRVFRGIVEQIEQHLLEQHRIEPQHRQVGCEIDLDAVARRAPWPPAAARCRRRRRDRPARAAAAIGAGFEPRHVEQIGDEAVQPLGLVLDGAEQLVPRVVVERLRRELRRLVAEPRIEASGVRRSCEIEVSSADAQPLGLGQQAGAVDVLRRD